MKKPVSGRKVAGSLLGVASPASAMPLSHAAPAIAGDNGVVLVRGGHGGDHGWGRGGRGHHSGWSRADVFRSSSSKNGRWLGAAPQNIKWIEGCGISVRCRFSFADPMLWNFDLSPD